MRVAGYVLASVVAGFAGGYAFAQNKLIKEFNLKLETELQRTRDFYDIRYGINEKLPVDEEAWAKANHSNLENETPDSEPVIVDAANQLTQEAGQALTNYQSGPMITVSEAKKLLEKDDPTAEQNAGWEAKEEQERAFDLVDDNPYVAKPYIIDADSFLENEADYEQITLTYYKGDMTLANQSDEVLDTQWTHSHTGFENLSRFGEKSGDKNIVYIRCEKYKQDFEVCRSEGKYSVEVAGLEEG